MVAILNPQRWLEKPSYPVELHEGHWIAPRANIVLPYWHGNGLLNIGTKRSLASFTYNGNSRTSVDAFGEHYNIATLGDYINGGATAAHQLSAFTILIGFRPSSIAAYNVMLNSSGSTTGGAYGYEVDTDNTGKLRLVQSNTLMLLQGTRPVTTTRIHWGAWSYDATSGRARIALNGMPDTTGTQTCTFTHSQLYVGKFRNDNAVSQVHRQYLVMIAAGESSMAELCALTAEPYAILRPRRPVLYYFKGTAGGAATVGQGLTKSVLLERRRLVA